MDIFGDMISKFLEIGSILLCIIISLNWFQRKNTNNKNKSKVFTAIKIFAVLFLVAVCISDILWYIKDISDPKERSLMQILFLNFK